MKQKQDFYNLNKYIKLREKEHRNKSMVNISIENGGSYIYNNNNYNNRYSNRYNNYMNMNDNYNYYTKK